MSRFMGCRHTALVWVGELMALLPQDDFGLGKEVPHAAGTHPDKHLHKFRGTEAKERHLGLARYGARQTVPCQPCRRSTMTSGHHGAGTLQPPPRAWISSTAAVMRRPLTWTAVVSLLRAVVWAVITLR